MVPGHAVARPTAATTSNKEPHMLRFEHAQSSAMAEDGKVLWGKTYEWEVDAPVEKVWGVTKDFVGIDKWVPSIVRRSVLVEGLPQTPGAVRRSEAYPAVSSSSSSATPTPSSSDEAFPYNLEQLLAMDEARHMYQYAIVGGNIPGFSLMQDYVSTFQLLPLPHGHGRTALRWSYVARPVAALTQDQSDTIAHSLYAAAVADLKKVLAS